MILVGFSSFAQEFNADKKGFCLVIEKQYIRDGRAPIPNNEAISRVMSANKSKNTKPELILRKALYGHGLSGFRLHWKKAPGRPDISYPGKKLAIFVNGCFWHRCPNCNPPMPKSNRSFWEKKFVNNVARDSRKSEELNHNGWSVLVFWECEINENVSRCVEEISLHFERNFSTKF